jgi:hypothetical protein
MLMNTSTSGQTTRSSNWRPVRRFLMVVAVMATVIALFYSVENWRGRRAWQQYREQQEAKGEALNFEAFVPDPIPDDQNFAMTPLLAGIFDALAAGTNQPTLDEAGQRRKRMADALKPRGDQRQPTLGEWSRGELTDLETFARFFRSNTNFPQAAPNATSAEVILTALKAFDSDFVELREAAATRPEARFPIRYEQEPPMTILLPHLSSIREIVTLSQLNAIALLEARQPDDALKMLQVSLRASNAVRDEPFLINHLVRLATLNAVLLGVYEGLARNVWSESHLVRIDQQLAEINLLAECQHAMRGERTFNIRNLEYYRLRPGEIAQLLGVSTSPKLFLLMPGGWLRQNEVAIGRCYDQYVLPAIDPERRRVSPSLVDQSDESVARLKPYRYTVFAKMLMPAVSKCSARTAQTQTMIDAARIACALERFRLAQGALPESLESLVPQYLKSIPTDVIDGRPLRFLRESGGGYKLYSIGWNQMDDGGAVGFRKQGKALDPQAGDWAWQMPKR